MIIVEGPDGAGKTTLVQKMSKDLGDYALIHDDGDREDLPGRAHRVLPALATEFVVQTQCPIYDRLYFSELVYGSTLRGYNLYTLEQQRVVERVLKLLNVPIIYCLPPYGVVDVNVIGSDHLEGVYDSLHEIYQKYERLWTGWHRVQEYSDDPPVQQVFKFDYTDEDPTVYQDILLNCRNYINNRKARLWN